SHFDAVLLIDVLYHRNIGDELAALRECARVLRPGGVLVMQVPAYDWLWGKHDIETHGARRYTRSRIKELVKDSGLEIVKAGYRNLLPLPAAIILRKSASGGGLSRLPPWLNNILYICATAENLLAEAIPLPAGLSVFCVAQKAAKRAA
ncbi:class I SAM-dependent methyltransferase, partial [bacterium]